MVILSHLLCLSSHQRNRVCSACSFAELACKQCKVTPLYILKHNSATPRCNIRMAARVPVVEKAHALMKHIIYIHSNTRHTHTRTHVAVEVVFCFIKLYSDTCRLFAKICKYLLYMLYPYLHSRVLGVLVTQPKAQL